MRPAPFPRLAGQGVRDDELVLGHVLGAFGVRGEVRLFLHHPTSALWSGPVDAVLVDPDGGRHAVTITTRPGAGKKILARLDGLDDRDVAAALRDWTVAFPTERLPAPAPDEFYLWQVLGADVRVGDRVVGTLRDVQGTDGPDVLVIDTDDGPAFVPCVREWVVSVDADAGVIELAPGALDDDLPERASEAPDDEEPA